MLKADRQAVYTSTMLVHARSNISVSFMMQSLFSTTTLVGCLWHLIFYVLIRRGGVGKWHSRQFDGPVPMPVSTPFDHSLPFEHSAPLSCHSFTTLSRHFVCVFFGRSFVALCVVCWTLFCCRYFTGSLSHFLFISLALYLTSSLLHWLSISLAFYLTGSLSH